MELDLSLKPSKATILGCGSSSGVPLLGHHPKGYWGTCDPSEPKNRRTRASIFVEYRGLRLLVDTSTDLRYQLLRQEISDFDGILFTHGHADHTHGIDEVRPLFFARNKEPFPIYGDAKTLEELKKRFSYLFKEGNIPIYPKILMPHEISGTFDIQGIKIFSFEQGHGPQETSLGFRFGSLAYSTDFNNLNDHALAQLQNLDTWIVDCTDYKPKLTHNHLELTLKWIKKVNPKRAVLTHMNHNMDYQTLLTELPETIEPAYDGMEIEF